MAVLATRAFQTMKVFSIGAALGAVITPIPAAAATCTWTGAGGDARWSNSSNWTGCPVPVTGDLLMFTASGTPLAVNDIPGLRVLIVINGTPALGSYAITGLGVESTAITVNAPADSSGAGPTLSLPITIPDGSSLFLAVMAAPLTITGAISAGPASQLIKSGAAGLSLPSVAATPIRLAIESGTVWLHAAGALPAGSRVTMLSADAELDLNGHSTTLASLDGDVPGPRGAGYIELRSATLTIDGGGSFNGFLNGLGGSLVKNGQGTFTLTGPLPNSVTGTTIVNAGTLVLRKPANSTAIDGPLIINGGTVRTEAGEQIDDLEPVTINAPGTLMPAGSGRETIGSIEGNGSITLDDGDIAIGANNRTTTFTGTITGSFNPTNGHSVAKVGMGSLTLTGAHTYRGYTRVEGGTLIVNGSIAEGSFPEVNVYGGTLAGVGAIARRVFAMDPASTISPGASPGILRMQRLALAGTFVVELNGPTAGSGYDQIDITSEMAGLYGARLQVSRTFGPPAGTTFTIVKAPAGAAHAPSGTFAGLPEGAVLLIDHQPFRISYRGGAGNDIVLTAIENPPALSIDDLTVTEGHDGTTDAVFTVTLSHPLADPIGVQYATANAVAVAPRDYTPQSGTLVFLPGTTTQTIRVPVTGDRDVEGDETFRVVLSGLTGTPVARGQVSIARAEATGTIATDDSVRTYYLAEGATGNFFDEDILIANPNDTIAPVTLTFLTENGEPIVATRAIAARSHVTVHVDLIPGLESASASVEVTSESGVPLIVERTMFWDASHVAGHTGSAVEQPAADWLFAEGAEGFFRTFVLVANPHATPTDVTFTFLPEHGAPVVVARTIAPKARLTLAAADVPELMHRSFGIAVHATQPILADRAMYFGTMPGEPWRGGTVSAGVTHPATHWFLAEGATGSFFDTFILLSNPQDAAANVDVRYLLDSGETIALSKVVPAHGRLTIDIEAEGDPRLRDAAVSTVIASDLAIVAERSMYWTGAPWREAHNSFGVVDLGTRWALAEGRVGSARRFHTYVLLANPQADEARVTVTYLREEGAPLVRQYTVPPTSRFTIDVNAIVPEMRDESFGTLIEVTNGVPIAVERSMYWDAAGVFWSGGTNAAATRLP